MLVLYHNSAESLISSLEDEQKMIDNLFTEEYGRHIKNFKRVEGDIFKISHELGVFFTALDED